MIHPKIGVSKVGKKVLFAGSDSFAALAAERERIAMGGKPRKKKQSVRAKQKAPISRNKTGNKSFSRFVFDSVTR